LVVAARTCTGDVTVDPFCGKQIVTDGLTVLGVQVVLAPTLTVAAAVADPPAPVAVIVYVVVAVGLTDLVPDVPTAPIPLSIVTEVAFVLDQVNVDDCPEVMVVGLADSVTVGAPVEVPTVTVAVEVTVAPFEPVAVAV
jgi:hypothetical protein